MRTSKRVRYATIDTLLCAEVDVEGLVAHHRFGHLSWDASTQEIKVVQKNCHFDLGADFQGRNLVDKADPDCVVTVTKRTVMQGRPRCGERSAQIGWTGLGRGLQCEGVKAGGGAGEATSWGRIEIEVVQKNCHFDLGADFQGRNLADKADPECVVTVTKWTVMQGRPRCGERSTWIRWMDLGRGLQCEGVKAGGGAGEATSWGRIIVDCADGPTKSFAILFLSNAGTEGVEAGDGTQCEEEVEDAEEIGGGQLVNADFAASETLFRTAREAQTVLVIRRVLVMDSCDDKYGNGEEVAVVK
ncbi:hypothetical protein EI94DRAFT_1711060 [Lactarius quietus]|nr:hypothetical protein EI94DRAFT_1711060 [Lactarius quietus]